MLCNYNLFHIRFKTSSIYLVFRIINAIEREKKKCIIKYFTCRIKFYHCIFEHLRSL